MSACLLERREGSWRATRDTGYGDDMSQWIDRPGPDDDPVVRVEDDLTDAGEHRPAGVDDVHGDVKRDGADTRDAGPQQRAGGEPAKKHGDPLH